jgi:hypothetical protein
MRVLLLFTSLAAVLLLARPPAYAADARLFPLGTM